MRNIETREGYEFWDKICAVQSYAFLLSPDCSRVVKTPDVGDWIDKHDAQVIVDHAQEDFNVMKSELAALREELARKDVVIEDMVQSNCDMGQFLAVAEQRNAELVVMLRQAWIDECVSAEDCRKIDAAIKPTESGESE